MAQHSHLDNRSVSKILVLPVPNGLSPLVVSTFVKTKGDLSLKGLGHFFVLLFLSVCGLPAIAANEGAEAVKQPVQARIEPKHKLTTSEDVGNVVVTYKDGAEDTWTVKGNCMMPKVAPQGHVGWVVCELANGKSLKLYADVPIGSRLAICSKGKVIAVLQSAKPFIEDWDFAADGEHVVVKSRAARGPATIELFLLHNGPAEAAVEAYKENLPAWAQPFRED